MLFMNTFSFLTTMHASSIMHAWNKRTISRCEFVRAPNANSRSSLLSWERACWIPWNDWSLRSLNEFSREKQMLLTKKIKLKLSEQDAATFEFMQGKCRGLYNWWVMRLRAGERWNFAEAKRSLQESKHYDPELAWVYGKLLHEVFYRLDASMQAFFRRR